MTAVLPERDVVPADQDPPLSHAVCAECYPDPFLPGARALCGVDPLAPPALPHVCVIVGAEAVCGCVPCRRCLRVVLANPDGCPQCRARAS